MWFHTATTLSLIVALTQNAMISYLTLETVTYLKLISLNSNMGQLQLQNLFVGGMTEDWFDKSAVVHTWYICEISN